MQNKEKEMTKLYKVLILITAFLTAGTSIGGYLLLPKQVEDFKKEIREEIKTLKLMTVADHDTLIEVKTEVKTITRKLENKGIVNYEQMYSSNSFRLAPYMPTM